MNGVFTNDYRVTYVTGYMATDTDPGDGSVPCGPNSPFPLELTIRQADELLYRVNRAAFTGGSLIISGIGEGDGTISAPTADSGNRMIYDGPYNQKRHGYVTQDSDAYDDAPYDAGSGAMFSEIGSNENGIWQPVWNHSGDSTVDPFTEFTDAFRFNQIDLDGLKAGDSDWFGYPTSEEGGVNARVFRGHRIAVVKADPADSFYAATTRFFLEVEFYIQNIYPGSEGGGDCVCTPTITTFECNYENYPGGGGPFDASCTLTGSLPTSDTDYGVKFSGTLSTPGGDVYVDLSWDSPGIWKVTLSGAISATLPGIGGDGIVYTNRCQPNPYTPSDFGSPGDYEGFYYDGVENDIWITGPHSTCEVPPYVPPYATFGASTNAVTGRLGDFDSTKTEVCNYIIRLNTGDISCPLYATESGVTGTDFIHAANYWFEFAKGSPAVPVWNAYTGDAL